MRIGDYEPFDRPEKTAGSFDIAYLLESLPDKERRVVKESLAGRSSAQIARGMNYTREWIRALYSRAIDSLRELAAKQSLEFVDFEGQEILR